VTKLNPTGSALLYSTYLGGSNEELGWGLAVDSAGNAYVTGWTYSSDFSTTLGAVQPAFGGVSDTFVTKLNPAGSALLYSTYLGGSGEDGGFGLAVDNAGNVYIAGKAASPNFPTTPGAVQPTFGGGPFDAFVTKLNPAGSALLHSTYLGSGRDDDGFGLAVDSTGNVYVTGMTESHDFPTTPGAVQLIHGGYASDTSDRYDVYDAFVAKIFDQPANQSPIANAGPDQAIHAGQTVTLDGSASFDDNTPTAALQFAWTMTEQPVGSTATLSGANTSSPTFMADKPGDYRVTLVVTDSDLLSSAPDEVLISSLNANPTANAGADHTMVIVGHTVTLTGIATDPDSDALTSAWTLATPAGSGATLSSPTSLTTSFVADVVGSFTAMLTVSDPFGGSNSDTVTISVITGVQFAENETLAASQFVQALTSGQVTTAGNQRALQNFLTQVIAALQASNTATAISKLQNALERTDGCVLRGAVDGNGPGRDWVTDCSAQVAISTRLTAALDALMP
jgi:hypothetical protein